ncbi:DUF411 domain-containing protein [Sneathiella sp.]|uniref:DUF411 domain-containing protein n=1 Tax=Sneathiella sp. TaxID=1964365 RepID=UPI003FA7B82E
MKKIIGFVAFSAFVVAAYMYYEQKEAVATEVTLYKNPQCQCCESYADYLRENGFVVSVKPTHDLVPMSKKAGIPEDFQGCHLAFIDNYVVSGHVPINTVKKLLTEKPDIKGLTLPGMPTGSPGMGGPKTGSFIIYQINDKQPTIYTSE